MNGKSLTILDHYKSWTPYFLSLLRAVSGFLFLQHGLQKVFGILESKGQPPLTSMPGIAGLIEVIAGILLIVGLFTRPIAFLASGTMAVAYFMSHAPQGFWPIINKGELAALYAFVFLFLSAAGAGPISLDAMFSRKSA